MYFCYERIESDLSFRRRMCGHNVVFVPGFDHAGIATQLVVRKWLERDKRLSKKDLEPEEFQRHCTQWKNNRCEEITQQLNRLGSSLDWGKCYYTLDEKFSHAVKYAFQRLFNEGLIFRDNRLVNWSPYLKSTLSDVEVETIRVEQPTRFQIPGSPNKTCEFGWLYNVNYELVDENHDQFITVATTRPETIPADCALAVNPSDQRYSGLIGRYCKNPLIESNIMPIIADSEEREAEDSSGTETYVMRLSWPRPNIDLERSLWQHFLHVTAIATAANQTAPRKIEVKYDWLHVICRGLDINITSDDKTAKP
uniref:valine--tRNA ligase n=1 Tax=Romanomermis culicivorax TaxID=13658 RepID=A0A915I6I0_ROMCU